MLKPVNLPSTRRASLSRFSARVLQRQINTPMSFQRRAFILDFDGTITTKDTIDTLFNIGLLVQGTRGRQLTAFWIEITGEYRDDYLKHEKDYSPAEEERKTLIQEIEYCRSLNGVEIRSFERVSRSGVFKGISRSEWEVFGRGAVRSGEVVIREGFREFVENVEKSGGVWGVVSVNFSSPFIRGVLTSAGVEASTVEVLANEPDENGTLLGPKTREGRSVTATSDAKLASMKAMLNLWRIKSGDVSKVVYIGDSRTDIECLTEEGTTGIVIAQDKNSNLMETLSRVGMDVKHIDDYRDGEEGRVYWARDLREIVGNSSLLSQQIAK